MSTWLLILLILGASLIGLCYALITTRIIVRRRLRRREEEQADPPGPEA
jgi:hypothetical protein